uniref:G-protein coupled receptors family 1 profile domain-containing protein n=1 Tax=Globodera rostochiensis TaxID=31243 RepID=A0A914IDE9_GLORO
MPLRNSPVGQRPNAADAAANSIFHLSQIWLTLASFEQLQEMLSWLLNGPLSLLFVLSGIVLNALCVVVFLRFRLGGGTTPIIHYYLISLAGWHSALLCNAFLLYGLPTLLWGSVVSSGPYVHLYPPTYTLANATHTGTVWIILALTLDRYLALCMPFKHRIFSKRSRVKRLVVGLSVGALFFCLPRFFEVRTAVECYDTLPPVATVTATVAAAQQQQAATVLVVTTVPLSNATVIVEGPPPQQMATVSSRCETFVQRTGLPENQLYRTIYHILLGSAFVTILPGVLTFVLTLRISITLGEARRQRKRLSHCCNHLLLDSAGGGGSTTTRTTTISTERESLPENCVSGGEKQQQQYHHRMVLLSASAVAGGRKPSLKRKEHRANVMLVVIIVKFLISDILPTVLDVFETFIGNEVFMASPLATLWVDFSNFLLVINCSTNFWVFLLYVRGFRQRCVHLIANSFRCSPQSPRQHDEASGFGGSCIASLRPSTPHFSANGFPIVAHGHRARGSAGGGEYAELGKAALNNVVLSQQNANSTPLRNGLPNLNGRITTTHRQEVGMEALIRPKRASSLAISAQQRSPLSFAIAVQRPSSSSSPRSTPTAASAANRMSTGQPPPPHRKKGSLAAAW